MVSESEAVGAVGSERQIGDIISETRNLDAEQVAKILRLQNEKGIRFGEAAVQLGFASQDDVLFALSQQFHYPYSQDKASNHVDLVTLGKPFSIQAEAFRALRSQVIMRLYSEPIVSRAFAILSPNVGDGKSFCAANLAIALAQLGGRTLLVDADMRVPRQHELFGIKNDAGLSGILSGRAESRVIQQVVGVPSLFVLPVGVVPPNPVELLERPAFGLLIQELASKFDHVIVDTPAAYYGSDAAVIAAKCGAALLVSRKNESRVDSLQDLVASLTQTSVKLAGVVMNEY